MKGLPLLIIAQIANYDSFDNIKSMAWSCENVFKTVGENKIALNTLEVRNKCANVMKNVYTSGIQLQIP